MARPGAPPGGIAHDFNNLLTAIRGKAELIRFDLERGRPVGKLLGRVEVATDRAAALCDQMLSYVGQNPPAREEVHLDEPIDEIFSLLRASVSRRIEVETEFDPEVPAVYGDGSQLRQVVMNLILNAADAIGDASGRIVLRTGIGEFGRDYMAGTYLLSDEPAGSYATVEAVDGRHAVEQFGRCGGDFQLAILDVMMPGRSGIEAMEALRRQAPRLPVILISGYDGHVVGRTDQPFEFCRKPFALGELLERVRECCAAGEEDLEQRS